MTKGRDERMERGERGEKERRGRTVRSQRREKRGEKMKEGKGRRKEVKAGGGSCLFPSNLNQLNFSFTKQIPSSLIYIYMIIYTECTNRPTLMATLRCEKKSLSLPNSLNLEGQTGGRE